MHKLIENTRYLEGIGIEEARIKKIIDLPLYEKDLS